MKKDIRRLEKYQLHERIIMHGIDPKWPSQCKSTIALNTIGGDRRSASRQKSDAWTVRFYTTQWLHMVRLTANTLIK